MTDHVLVCDACGSRACWDGDYMCDGSLNAGTVDCPCMWDEGYRDSPSGVDPRCPAHGTAS